VNDLVLYLYKCILKTKPGQGNTGQVVKYEDFRRLMLKCLTLGNVRGWSSIRIDPF